MPKEHGRLAAQPRAKGGARQIDQFAEADTQQRRGAGLTVGLQADLPEGSPKLAFELAAERAGRQTQNRPAANLEQRERER